MIPHHIVFVHGIGDEPGGFSEWIRPRIFDAFSKTVHRLTGEAPSEGSINFREALWSEVTQPQQDMLWNVLFPTMKIKGKSMRAKLPWRLLLTDVPTNPKSWLHHLKYWSWFRKAVVVYQGDLMAYIESPGDNKYKRIHDIVFATIADCMRQTMTTEATGQNPAPVTIVGHSLGSVIASDALYDAHQNKNRWWPAQLCLTNLFSLGCPLSLYTLRYKMDTENDFQKAVRMQNPNGLWINIFDPQDIVGYPLKPLNTAYSEAVFLDKEISLGHWWNPWHLLLRWTPFNHYMYWEDYSVAYIIGKKTALDWIQTNRPKFASQLKLEYAAYEDELRASRSKYP